ncbi:MAG TPA: cobalamin-dependent protein, partial [Mesotoga sp.]|nr:cobalamin-dependent protein [Mesotoga sp.]
MDITSSDLELAFLSASYSRVREQFGLIVSEHGLQVAVDSFLVDALDRIGRSWADGSASLSQVYISGKISERLLDEFARDREHKKDDSARIAIVTLYDRHTLGKRIVRSFLRSSGYEIVDLGSLSSNEELLGAVKKYDVEILLISVLMLHSALKIESFITELKGRGFQTRVVVGGAPFNADETLWR